MMKITSRDNPKLKQVRALENKKNRDETGLYLIESTKLIKEGIKGKVEFEYILISEFVVEKKEYVDLEEKLKSNEIECYIVDDKIFKGIATTTTSQGIIGVAKKRIFNIEQVIESNFLIFCDKIQDPGNLGTIIRTCDAFGPATIVLSRECVDVYNSKTVRAAAGAMFRVPIVEVENNKQFFDEIKCKGFYVVSTVVNSNNSFENIKSCNKICMVIGNEGNGISQEVRGISDICITIKMTGETESLNASIAAAISIYEIRKKLS